MDNLFYSYEAKYCGAHNVKTFIPANLTTEEASKISEIAKKTFNTLRCKGWARIDFLMDQNGIYVSEVNTIPGCTSVSMYSKMLENSGISQKEVFQNLVTLALKTNHKKSTKYKAQSKRLCV